MGVCRRLESLQEEAAATNQMRLAEDLKQQKNALLQLSVNVHALLHVTPHLQSASVVAVVFGKLPRDNAVISGCSCVAVRTT
jgi:hypothetical protein